MPATATAYPHLFTPIQIGGMTVANRICFAATSSELGDANGYATETMAEYYATRARGGAGLLVLEAVYVEMEGRRLRHNLMLHDDSYLPGLTHVAAAIHAAGGKVALQLNHGGREAVTAVSGSVPLGPSPIAAPYTSGGKASAPRELTLPEIARIVRRFGESAARARQAGFDAVEIHGAHGYLVAQFLSPEANQRQDDYGRDQKGRARFVREIIAEIKRQAGADFPVILRMNSSDQSAGGGTELDLACITAVEAEAAGADAISVTGGVHASRPYRIAPGMMVPTGWNRPAMAEIRRHVKIPVMGVGRITTPELAEEILAAGEADIVCLSRALIADPEFPNKARAGQSDRIVPCIACNECMSAIYYHDRLACTVNPIATRELELANLLAARPDPKRVVVIGAGAGGMSAAIAAANRGHRVTLFEASDRLGGLLNLAHRPPQREALADLLHHYQRELQASSVEIRLGHAPTPDEIRGINPDTLLIGIGSRSRLPDIPGIDQPLVRNGWRILAGEQEATGPCAVIGGGLVGVEVADHLNHQGHQVILIARSTILKKATNADSVHYRDKLAASDIEVIEHCAVEAIGPDWLRIHPNNRQPRTIHGLGSVVVCIGYDDRMDDAKPWANLASEVRYIGDVKGGSKFFDAIREGTMAALEIS